MFKRLLNKKKEAERIESLAVGSQDKKIFLLRRKISAGKHFLLLHSSKDGTKFSGKPQELVLKYKDRSHEDISLCSDFRLSGGDEGLALTYLRRDKTGQAIRYATSSDGEKWLVVGKFKDIHFPAGMVMGKEVSSMYFGADSLNVVTSKNLRSWTTDEPSRVPQWHFSEGRPLNIIGAVSMPEGIAVFYSILVAYDIFTDVSLHNEKVGREHLIKIGAAIFSTDNPKHLLWQSEVPIAELPLAENEQASFLGVVPVALSGKTKVLRIYVAKKTDEGEMGFIELPHDILSDHRIRKPITLTKSADNPILRPTINKWEDQGVFNPTAVQLDNTVHLLYRAVGDDGSSRVGYASSKNGTTVDERLNSPVYTPTKPFEKVSGGMPPDVNQSLFHSGGSWGGCEDPKATIINDRIYMTYVAHVGTWPMRTALTSISIKDFLKKRWRWTAPMLMSAPNIGSKSVVILPEKVRGNYVIFHRIWPNIIVDFVPELVFGEGKRWLGNRGIISPRRSFWDSQKLSMGAAPIKTDKGWLAIYNAVDRLDSSRYKIGAMLLSLDDPRKVIARSRKPILSPDEWYENDGKPGIAYPSGAVLRGGTLYVYYGGADKVSCVATFPIDQLLENLLKDGEPSSALTPISV